MEINTLPELLEQIFEKITYERKWAQRARGAIRMKLINPSAG